MPIKGLLLVWFILLVGYAFVTLIINAWTKANRYRTYVEDFPWWLIALALAWIIDLCLTIVYTIVWLCYM